MTEHADPALLLMQTLLGAAAQLLPALARQTLVLSFGLLALLLLRPVLRWAGGLGAVHAAWIALPLGLVAQHLPGPATPAPTAAVELVRAAGRSLQGGVPALSAPGSAWPASLLVTWALGAALLILLQGYGHHRARWQLDRESRPWRSPAGCSPALLGLWRPRLVLPRDFEQRFTPAEQALVLAHEQVHARRGDNAWTLLARLLVCLHWFNPLAWWALHRFTRDQELACDALVLQAASRGALAPYASALLKCGHGPRERGAWPALATSWQNTHPLKERILMLKSHTLRSPKAWPARLGAGLCTALIAGTGYSVHAEAPAPVELRLTIHDGGLQLGQPRLLVQEGQNAVVELKPDPSVPGSRPLRIGITPQALSGERYRLNLQLSQGEPLTPWAQPVLVVKQGEPARIEIGEADRLLRLDVVARPAGARPSLPRDPGQEAPTGAR